MPHESVLERIHIDCDQAAHDIAIQERYEAPAGPDGEVAFDVHKDYDRWCAARAMAVLKTEYAGHFWAVESDVRNHLIKISIPILMGFMHWYVINLRTHELTKATIIEAGGNILERYGLPRGIFTDAFFDARTQHSKLVDRHRLIPA